MEPAFELAGGILESVHEDADDAFLKGRRGLASVLFICTPEESREEMIDVATDKLRNYMKLLDEVAGMGAGVVRRRH